MAVSWACSRLWWGTLALLIHATTLGNTASYHQMLRLCDRNVHFSPDAFCSGADHQQQTGRRRQDDDPCQRQCPCWPSEAAPRQPSPSRWALRLRGGRGGKARQIKAAKGGGKPMKGDTLRSMAPSINREEEENRGGGGLKGGKLLKQRGKWENPHNPNRRLSIRQGRVQRANRDVQASCKAALERIQFLKKAAMPRKARPVPRSEPVASSKPEFIPSGSNGQPIDFVASAEFSGRRMGYVFKKGKKGIGYYADDPGKIHHGQKTWGGAEDRAAGARPSGQIGLKTSVEESMSRRGKGGLSREIAGVVGKRGQGGGGGLDGEPAGRGEDQEEEEEEGEGEKEEKEETEEKEDDSLGESSAAERELLGQIDADDADRHAEISENDGNDSSEIERGKREKGWGSRGVQYHVPWLAGRRGG